MALDDDDDTQNGLTYRQCEKQVINYSPSHVGENIGELWSANKKVNIIGAHVDPPKIDTARAVRMIEHVTCDVATSEISIPPISLPVRPMAPAASRYALSQISS